MSIWLKIGTHGILEVLIPNPDLYFWNSDPKIHFWANLSPKIQNCPFCLKIGVHSISRMLIPNPDLDFWNFDPKIHFWANLGPKIQSCSFFLKIGTHGISRMLIFIPTLAFWVSNPNFLFGQIWATKVQIVRLNSNLAHMISQGCSFLFQHFLLNFELKIHFWANLGQESQICSFCLEIGTFGILRMRILIPRLDFWILKPKSI